MSARSMKRVISLLCAFLLLSTGNGCSRRTTTDQISPGIWVETDYLENIPSEDFNGYTFRVLVSSDSGQTGWHNTITPETLEGCAYREAVFERNRLVTEMLNISISECIGEVTSIAVSDKYAEDGTMDLICPDLESAASLSRKGVLSDLRQREELRLDMPWWDPASIRDLSVGDRLFFAESDLNLQFVDVTYTLFYNRDLTEELNLEDPCALVRRDEWTFDRMTEMVRAATKDTDGNNIMEAPNDSFGIVVSGYTSVALLSGACERLIIPDGTGGYTPNLNSDAVLSIAEKARNLLEEKGTAITWRYEGLDPFVIEDNTVYNGHSLFCEKRLCQFNKLKQSGILFGIVPWPKMNETQQTYGNGAYWFRQVTLCCAMPRSVEDKHRTALIVEALATASRGEMLNRYYCSLYEDDPDCYEMLKILDEGRLYDLGFIFGWGEIASAYSEIASDSKQDIDAVLLKVERSFYKHYAKTLEQYNEISDSN